MRSDDAVEVAGVSGNLLPTLASLSMYTRTSRRPCMWWPIKSDSEHFPPEGKLRV